MPSGSPIWLLWHMSASTLRSTVPVVSTAIVTSGGAGRPHDPEFGHRPGLETLHVEQLGMGERVAGVGVDGTDRGLAGGQVVGVAGVDEVPIAFGRLGEHALGPYLADDPADVAPQFLGGLDPPVGVPEEVHVAHADHGGGGALLVLAQRGHLHPRHGPVRSAGLTVGDDAVGDLQPGRGERGHGARRTEVDVVGVGGDDEDTAHAVLG